MQIQFVGATDWIEEFQQKGYVEICDTTHGAETFDSLYVCFDELIEFFQINLALAQKLYCAKERFIRCPDRRYYSADFFGFYNEAHKKGRNQIAFYYSTHFHKFICDYYPELNQILPINSFLQICFQIQKTYDDLFKQVAVTLGIEDIFSSSCGHIPILLKVVKYFPDYRAAKPHYDGTAFSLFLDSTNNDSLLLAPYKSFYKADDFTVSARKCVSDSNQNSILLIPGTLLQEFLIYPTPHIVVSSGKTRYATIAFAMRPNHVSKMNDFSVLPNFKNFS